MTCIEAKIKEVDRHNSLNTGCRPTHMRSMLNGLIKEWCPSEVNSMNQWSETTDLTTIHDKSWLLTHSVTRMIEIFSVTSSSSVFRTWCIYFTNPCIHNDMWVVSTNVCCARVRASLPSLDIQVSKKQSLSASTHARENDSALRRASVT